MSFLPKDYKIPSTSNYYKFEEGDNTFRILGSFEDGTAIMGTEYWVTKDGKRFPKRLPVGQPVLVEEIEINPQTGEDEVPKHFWAMPVWNFETKSVQILEITQKTIMTVIRSLAKNPKWGDPNQYNLVVTRTKVNDKTNYMVTPEPKEELDKEVYKILNQMNIKIEKLFSGLDPFGNDKAEDLADKADKAI